MKIISRIFALLLLACFCISYNAHACTTFFLVSDKTKVVGKSYDWYFHHGMAVVNKRHIYKVGFTLGRYQPARWISKYGSLTFNQYGREFPNSGINEHGLTVEIMNGPSCYIRSKKIPAVNELQWIQYQLDNFANVAEAVKAINKIQIIPFRGGLHYMLCDPTGDCAIVEFLDKKSVVHTGNTLGPRALSNSIYQYCINKYATETSQPGSYSSLHRFLRVAHYIKSYQEPADAIRYAFRTLNSVARHPDLCDGYFQTQWQLTYDLVARQVHFRLANGKSVKQAPIKLFNLRTLDYSENTPVKIYDLDRSDIGICNAKFQIYSRAMNHKILQKSVKNSPFRPYCAIFADYPTHRTVVCRQIKLDIASQSRNIKIRALFFHGIRIKDKDYLPTGKHTVVIPLSAKQSIKKKIQIPRGTTLYTIKVTIP